MSLEGLAIPDSWRASCSRCPWESGPLEQWAAEVAYIAHMEGAHGMEPHWKAETLKSWEELPNVE